MDHAREQLGTASKTSTAREAETDQASAELVRRWYVNAWRPVDGENSYEIDAIEGEVPRELHGTLYRNGPSQKILPEQGYEALHLFDGDGFVHAFRFDDGRVHCTGRWVEDPSYVVEQEEARYCMTGLGVAVSEPTDRYPMRQQHNTNVVWHGGRLMTLVENAPPFEIDPRTLAPIGEHDLGGAMIGMSVSAHPKIDGKTGQMIIHGYQPFEPYVQWYVVERDGRCVLAEPVDAPYPSMMHDLAITENYVVFLLCPVFFDAEVLMTPGRPVADALRWEPERGLHFGVKRREAGSPVRWLEAPSPGYIFHPGNAYEEDGKIVLDACTYPDGGALLDTLRTVRRGETRPDWFARPFLYELDLEAGVCREHQLDDRAAEFPRIDDRLAGYRNRYGYAVRSRDADARDPWSIVMRYDRQGGASQVHDFGLGHWPSEPVFVPRTADAAESDGFVLCTVYDGASDASYLAVLDAANLGAQPLAKLHLKHRVPMGFHGNFAAGVV